MSSVIQLVRASVLVHCTVDHAFRTFTEDINVWWPRQTHSVAAAVLEGSVRTEEVVFEGRLGGRIYERMDDGREAEWGRVTAWDPPRRVVFLWKPNPAPLPPTEVEVQFIPEGSATRVELDHRGWERLGAAAEDKRRSYETGWPEVLAEFAASTPVPTEKPLVDLSSA